MVGSAETRLIGLSHCPILDIQPCLVMVARRFVAAARFGFEALAERVRDGEGSHGDSLLGYALNYTNFPGFHSPPIAAITQRNIP